MLFCLRTPFGCEYEIVAYTDLDSHRAEKDVNHWIVQTGHPPEPAAPATTLPLGTQQWKAPIFNIFVYN